MAPRYTQEEDDAIMRIFSSNQAFDARYREIVEWARTSDTYNGEPRAYSSYVTRYNTISARRHLPPLLLRSTSDSSTLTADSPRYAPTSPARYAPTSPANITGTVVGFFGNNTSSQQRTTQPQSRKRSIDELDAITDEDELINFEKKMINKIKRRRQELEEETKTLPTCGVCQDKSNSTIVTNCGHHFCVQCYVSCTSRPLPDPYNQLSHICPICRHPWNEPNKVHIAPQNATIAQCKKIFHTSA